MILIFFEYSKNFHLIFFCPRWSTRGPYAPNNLHTCGALAQAWPTVVRSWPMPIQKINLRGVLVQAVAHRGPPVAMHLDHFHALDSVAKADGVLPQVFKGRGIQERGNTLPSLDNRAIEKAVLGPLNAKDCRARAARAGEGG